METVSTCLSHLGIERGPMLTGSDESRTDAEMLEAAWRQAEREARKEKKRQKYRGSSKKGYMKRDDDGILLMS